MNLQETIYLDYSATTPVDPRVIERMLPLFASIYGNPSSVHSFGQQAEAAVELAREEIAAQLQCDPAEIIFTSCGSESDNLALRGAAFAQRAENGKNHLLISPVEHHAVSHTAQQLANHFEFELEFLPVDEAGIVTPEVVQEHLRPETALVSVIYANNEIGTVNPIPEIGAVCQKAGVVFHTDAVQAGAYLNLAVDELSVNLMSLGAHKFYGPKGIGVLYKRSDTTLLPMQTGGSQENGVRAGTQNVPYIVGMAEALKIAAAERQTAGPRLSAFRDRLVGTILEEIPGAFLTGHPTKRLANHASFVFDQVDGNALLMQLDIHGIACSSGSACKTGSPSPSEVLLALGIPAQRALGSLRVTLGRWTTAEQITTFASVLPGIIEHNRKLHG